jgi:hypothetical protein
MKKLDGRSKKARALKAALLYERQCEDAALFSAPVPEGGVGLRGTYIPMKFEDAKDASARQVAGDHYKTMGVEPWDVVDTWPQEQRIGAYRAGALKYLMRMGSKDQSAQEIAKGQHYMEKLLEVLNGK